MWAGENYFDTPFWIFGVYFCIKVGGEMAKGKYEKWSEPDGLLCLEAWARDGCTDETISKKMGVAKSTLNEWKLKFSAISDALKRGKEPVDIEVENALLKKATGFFQKITKVHKVKTVKMKDGMRLETEELIEKEEDVYFPPETVAQIFWLKNRKPDQWREKREPSNENNNETINENLLSLVKILQSPQPPHEIKVDANE